MNLDALAGLIAQATHAEQVTLDEHYELTAFVVDRGAGREARTVFVELIDRGPGHGNERWTVSAHDQLNSRMTALVTGATAREVITATRWDEI